jgi:drug/metabolite transporter (DMT)-like permease
VLIGLGLLASLLIGISDFLGARSAGRTTALQTTTAAFIGGAIAAALYSPLLGSPSFRDLGLGALSGVALAVALTTLWRAYAVASIGIAAPIASVLSTVVPVIYDAIGGEVPGALGWSGVAIGIAALFLTSWNPSRDATAAGDGADRRGVQLGVISGVCFSVMYLTAVSTSDAAGTWPVVSQRATAFVLAAGAGLLTRQRPFAGGTATRWSVLAGMFGASGVAAVVYAGQRGPLAPVVVSSSMYPAVAIGLGWVFLHQRLTRRQMTGIGAALVGVALIALD